MFTTVSNLLTRLPELNDEAAWQAFEKRYSPMLHLYFKRSVAQRHVVPELTQETMRRVVQGFRDGGFQRSRGKLRNWIAGIARHVLINHLRRSRGEVSQLQTDFWSEREDPDADGEIAAVDQRFDAVWVRARLSQLIRFARRNFEIRDLKCYFLVEIRKLPIKEVAGRLSLSESAVFAKRRQVANWMMAMGPRFISSWER